MVRYARQDNYRGTSSVICCTKVDTNMQKNKKQRKHKFMCYLNLEGQNCEL